MVIFIIFYENNLRFNCFYNNLTMAKAKVWELCQTNKD